LGQRVFRLLLPPEGSLKRVRALQAARRCPELAEGDGAYPRMKAGEGAAGH